MLNFRGLIKKLHKGIETSCDDTGAAVVDGHGRSVLGQCLNSQWDLLERFGGVFPSEAKRAHTLCIDAVVSEALCKAGIAGRDLSAIAVTAGPGLGICLDVGIRKAVSLAREFGVPLLSVNHMEAHALMPLMVPASSSPSVSFPFAALLLSGGHTMLVACHSLGQYQVVGTTLDDAVGEAFDKVWRLMAHPDLVPPRSTLQHQHNQKQHSPPFVVASQDHHHHHHPGALIERLALKSSPMASLPFRAPFAQRKDVLDYSFSGLKASVARYLEANPLRDETDAARVAATFQDVAFNHVTEQVARSFQGCLALRNVSTLIVSGGVANNQALRRKLEERLSTTTTVSKFVYPESGLCADNGVMVAWCAALHILAGLAKFEPDLERVTYAPRWEIGLPKPAPPRFIGSQQ